MADMIPVEHRQTCGACGDAYDARILDDVIFHLHDDTPGVSADIVGERVDVAERRELPPHMSAAAMPVIHVLERDTRDTWHFIVLENEAAGARHFACTVNARVARSTRVARAGVGTQDIERRARRWAEEKARLMAKTNFAENPEARRRG